MTEFKYNNLAENIIEYLGGMDNIVSAFNCMTRIRVYVKDDRLIGEEALKNVEGVLGIIHDQKNYIEVVVGPGRSRKCMEALRELGIAEPAQKINRVAEKEQLIGIKKILKTFGQIFVPLIPGIIAAGICAGLASLISQVIPGYADSRFFLVVYNLLSGVNASFMTCLAAWAGYRAAEMFGGTPILGGMVGMISTLDNIDSISAAVGLYNKAQPLNAILRSGRGGVLAAILGVWLMCRLEGAIRRKMPDALDTVLTPLLTLAFTLIPYIFIFMPVTGLVSMGLCRLVQFVAMNPHPLVRMIAGYLGAFLFLPMVAAGMHHGLIAIYTVQLDTFGYVTLYPALAMAGAGQVGAAIALAVKAKKTGNQRLLQAIQGALPAGILGVGEPLIYGVTLPMGKPFITAGLGAGFGGAFVMLMEVASTIWGPSGILGVFVMTEGPKGAVTSMVCYMAGLAISCIMGCIFTALLIDSDEVAGA